VSGGSQSKAAAALSASATRLQLITGWLYSLRFPALCLMQTLIAQTAYPIPRRQRTVGFHGPSGEMLPRREHFQSGPRERRTAPRRRAHRHGRFDARSRPSTTACVSSHSKSRSYNPILPLSRRAPVMQQPLRRQRGRVWCAWRPQARTKLYCDLPGESSARGRQRRFTTHPALIAYPHAIGSTYPISQAYPTRMTHTSAESQLRG